jgi:anti-anti-sigma regulatory factor
MQELMQETLVVNPLQDIQSTINSMLPTILLSAVVFISVFLVVSLVSLISRLRAQRATVQTQKDVRRILEILEAGKQPEPHKPVIIKEESLK